MTRRLYCANFDRGPAELTGPEAHHARDVLRLRCGDQVELFDGVGKSALATILDIHKSAIQLEVQECKVAEVIGPRITLATAIPKFAHQEFLVRMGTELGVSVFVPLICRHSSVREQFRAEKWQRWTLEACKQCGQNFLPSIVPPVQFDTFVDTMNFELVLFGDVHGAKEGTIRQKYVREMAIVVGPEGGFAAEELDRLRNRNAVPLRIGNNILRIETAAVALTAVGVFLNSDC